MGNQMSQREKDVQLVQAVEKGTDEQVQLLLDSGANPNEPPEDHDFLSRTALHHAALCKCSVKKLKLILEKIRDIDVTDDAGNTTMHYAARYRNNIEFIRTIVKHKPSCRIQNSRGKTALHNAVDIGLDVKTVELLLTRGDADPNIADWDGITPLHVCTSQKSVDPMVVGMLLRFGADPNRRDGNGQTPLHIAASTANVSVLLLLRYNARVLMRDHEGRLPADVAATDEIKNILLWEQEQIKEDGNTDDEHEYILKPKNSNSRKKKKRTKPNGEGVIRLLDGPAISVPQQSLPNGANLELSVKPSQSEHRFGSEQEWSVNEVFYDICLDLKIDIPGVLTDNWSDEMIEKSSSNTTDEVNSLNKLTSFTGMCINGGEQWRTSRDLTIKEDGRACLNFRLTRERSIISVGTPNGHSFSGSLRSASMRSSVTSNSSSSSSSSSSFSQQNMDKTDSMELVVDAPGEDPMQKSDAQQVMMDKTDAMELVVDALADDLMQKSESVHMESPSTSADVCVTSETVVSQVAHNDGDDDGDDGEDAEDKWTDKVEKQDAFDSLISQLSNGLTAD